MTNLSPRKPIVVFFDKVGTMVPDSPCAEFFISRIRGRRILMDHREFSDTVDSTMSKEAGMNLFRFLWAKTIQKYPLTKPYPTTPMTLKEHETNLEFYQYQNTSLAAQLINNPGAVAVVTMSYFQEYANNTLLSTELTLQEKASLLERYTKCHSEVFGGIESLRVLISERRPLLDTFCNAERAAMNMEQLNVQQLFTHNEQVEDSQDNGAKLVAKYLWPR